MRSQDRVYVHLLFRIRVLDNISTRKKMGLPCWSKLVLKMFSGPRIGSLAARCLPFAFSLVGPARCISIPAWTGNCYQAMALQPVKASHDCSYRFCRFWMVAFVVPPCHFQTSTKSPNKKHIFCHSPDSLINKNEKIIARFCAGKLWDDNSVPVFFIFYR